jgi:hypothetical protein
MGHLLGLKEWKGSWLDGVVVEKVKEDHALGMVVAGGKGGHALLVTKGGRRQEVLLNCRWKGVRESRRA